MDSELTLELRAVTKKLKGVNVVDQLSFSVKKGEIFGLLGPNGAGKTTAIRMMVGLISLSEGEIFIMGKNVTTQFEEAIMHVGGIVENPQLYGYLTGYKNLMQYARMMGVDKARVDEVVQIVELSDAIHKKVKTYSLGMRQRLGVAQAILHRPRLLILDEPTNGLDPQGMRDLRRYLRKLADEGTTVLVSSHILAEMELMCDRVAVIQKGKLISIAEVGNVVEANKTKTHIGIEGSLEKARDLLQAQHPNVNVLHSEQELILEVSSPAEIGAVNKTLVTAGFIVHRIETKKQSLEDQFIEMTSDGGAVV
ncbi:hypothetical protein A374_17734 [Fictibacillus macauensis ZFHKF-1]|uniref:ABC transporter domain-containing protein n=1 Tax=Fictibacillus macauensis ZFHKF-1 TaxID=1196324 RepID=I8UAC2_9BACL|nr:ABC transporter ATP-binding protein [Fictibacillus macauensis]EIT83900.1 hypothetical protein A374_17734 [Fictibacillus macauensis ZFHKF-1]